MFAEVLVERVAGFCSLSEAQVESLQKHYNLLVRWNRVLNLTSLRDEVSIVERHYAESLFLAVHLPAEVESLADLGSGAGFPGVPLAVVHPQCLVTLIESHQRKAVFLREATRDMPNVRVAAARSESLNEEFEWVVCRAVSYNDVAPELRRLGRRVALLAGFQSLPQPFGFQWEVPIPLPWGKRRILLLGRRESDS